MKYTTDVNQDGLLDGHLAQVEQQHASLSVQKVRDEAAGRDVSSTDYALEMLEKEHAALLKLKTAKKGGK